MAALVYHFFSGIFYNIPQQETPSQKMCVKNTAENLFLIDVCIAMSLVSKTEVINTPVTYCFSYSYFVTCMLNQKLTVMEKKRKGIQVYAIIVSIVAIITFIISCRILVAAFINRSDPVNSGHSRADLSSFENYKMGVMRSIKQDQAYIPSDTEISKMYDAAKEEKVNKVLHNTKRDIIVTSLLILISIALFVTHWLIIKRYSKFEDSTPV